VTAARKRSARVDVAVASRLHLRAEMTKRALFLFTLLAACADVPEVETLDAAAEPETEAAAFCPVVIGMSWRTPTLMSASATNLAPPDVATGANGDAMAAWLEYSNGSVRVKTARYVVSGFFRVWQTTSFEIADWSVTLADVPPLVGPRVVMDDQGDATVAWLEYARNGQGEYVLRVKSRYYNASIDGWFAPFEHDVITSTSPVTSPLGITSDANGNALLVWDRQTHVMYRRYTESNFNWTWSRSVEALLAGATELSVAGNASGDAIFLWQYQGATITKRYDAVWDTLEPPVGAIFTHGGPASAPQAAINNDGDIVLTWIEPGSFGTAGMRVVRWPAADASPPSTSTSFSSMIPPAGAPPRPGVAFTGDDHAVGVFHGNSGGFRNAYARRQTPTGTLVPSLSSQSLESTNDPASYPVIELTPGGNGFALWRQPNASNLAVTAARHAHQVQTPQCAESWTWGTPVTIQTTAGTAYEHALAVFPSGAAVAVWTQDGGIYGTAYR
jgi:hypothetical protein